MSQSRQDEKIICAQLASDVHRDGEGSVMEKGESSYFGSFFGRQPSLPQTTKIATEEEIMLARMQDDVCHDNGKRPT